MSQHAISRQELLKKLNELRAQEKRGQRLQAEGIHLEEEARENVKHLEATLSLFGIELDEVDLGSLDEASPKDATVDTVRKTSQNGTSSPQPSRKRERLPKGFKAECLMKNYEECERFLHVNEHVDLVNEKVQRRWPHQPHLMADRRSVNRPLKRLFEKGKLVRVQYGPSHNYIFHGLPRFVEEDVFGEKRFAESRYKPAEEQLRAVSEEPRFLEYQPEEQKEDEKR